MKDQPWLITIGNELIPMTNQQYLEFLLGKTRITTPIGEQNIRFLIWDLEEFKTNEYRFYLKNAWSIELEITALKRLLSYSTVARKPSELHSTAGTSGRTHSAA